MPYLGKQPVNLIKDNAVSTNKIADDAVTNAKLSNNAVNSTEIVDNAITTDKINGSAVTDAKLANDAVTTNKINNLAVEQGKIADQAINESKLQVSNAPVNNYVLTAQSGNTGGLTWASPGSIANFTTVTAGAVSNALTYDVTVQKDKLYLIELTGIWGSNETNNASGGNYMRLQASDNAGSTFISQHYGDAVTWYPSAGTGSTSAGATWLYLSRDLNSASSNILNAFATDPTYNLNLYYYQGSETGSNVFNSAVWGMGLHKNRDAVFVNGGFSGGTTSPINLLRFNINDASMNGYIRVLRRD
tara:strand:- start:902 stop:1810 length:909 start_codon:yes stop_codon:yes gene_type:complete